MARSQTVDKPQKRCVSRDEVNLEMNLIFYKKIYEKVSDFTGPLHKYIYLGQKT